MQKQLVEVSDITAMFTAFRMLVLRNGPDTTTFEKALAVARAWHPFLRDAEAEDLQKALEEIGNNSPFWPTPAEVRKLCPSLRKQALALETSKESGTGWWTRLLAAVGSYGINSTNAMERDPGSLASYKKAADPWATGRRRLISDLAKGDKAIEAALGAGIDAVGWRAFHEEGWKYRENAMRPVFENAFAVAHERFRLEHGSGLKAIEGSVQKQIAAKPAVSPPSPPPKPPRDPNKPVEDWELYDF